MASNASLPMCQLTVCEDGHYQTFDTEDLNSPKICKMSGTNTGVSECNRQACTAGVVPWPTSGSFQQTVADREDENMRVSGEMLEMEQVDADLYQQGRDAMQDNGSTLEIPITEAVGEKHIHGFAIAHVQEANASWRLVATDCQDGTQGGQSPGLTTTHDVECNLELCTIVFQRRWRTRTKDTRMGRTHSVLHRPG